MRPQRPNKKEEVVLQLIKTKCKPSLLYGLEACSLVKSELSSLDFVVNRFLWRCSERVTQKLSVLLQFRLAKWAVITSC